MTRVVHTYKGNLLTVELNGRKVIEEEIFDRDLAMDKVANIEEKASFKDEKASREKEKYKLSVYS